MGEVSNILERIAHDMARSCSDINAAWGNIRSLFLIGSCSQGPFSDDWYQDYDVHFLVDDIAICRPMLDWLAQKLDEYVSWSTPRCRVEAGLRDRHWKMLPILGIGNIGIHATVLSRADHYRRVYYNPLLALNMYGRCRVLYGEHPQELRGFNPPSKNQYVFGVGGLGWMEENFNRAAALWCLLPEDRTFYPYIGGYCWNVISTFLFHLYTLETGRLAGRVNAFEHFAINRRLQGNVLTAAELIRAHRHDPSHDRTLGESLFEAVATITAWVRDQAIKPIPALGEAKLPKGIIALRDCYKKPRQRIGIEATEWTVADVAYQPEPSNFIPGLRESLKLVTSEISGTFSAKEQFEFLRDLIAGKAGAKIRVWSELSYPRRVCSHDFDLDRGCASEAGVLFGWEDGVQALLQRLHEVYVEKRDAEDFELLLLCDFSLAIIQDHLELRGISFAPKLGCGFDFSIDQIASILEPFIPFQTARSSISSGRPSSWAS
jgi:hypothetical protein